LVEFLYGGIFPTYSVGTSSKKRYQMDKGTFDICFVAHKYTEKGVDKGYDVFIETARILSKARNDIFFHIVGPFHPTDIDVTDIKEKILFYGTRKTEFFLDFYLAWTLYYLRTCRSFSPPANLTDFRRDAVLRPV
jgi:glycosyltransferase involved in cell wall biosynthesis